jgi:hypothetical protein
MVLGYNSEIMEMKIVAMEKEDITSSFGAGGAAPSADLVLKCKHGAACDIGASVATYSSNHRLGKIYCFEDAVNVGFPIDSCGGSFYGMRKFRFRPTS